MKQTLLLAIFICLSFITVVGQQSAVRVESGTWINVAPVDAGFKVLMPAKPSEQTTAVTGHPELENHVMSLETELAGYVVSYLQFPDEVTDANAIREMLDRGREGGVAASGGTLKGEKEIKLNNYVGREWMLELPGGLSATARAYWVKRRLYQTVFVARSSVSDPPDITKLRQEVKARFLDSFLLNEDNSK
ncbi:MAG: hypothetical protein M3R67_08410 [Acidobacteriota bacterium]|nr:hypothetical protein [Acidobacteriota bacterium]